MSVLDPSYLTIKIFFRFVLRIISQDNFLISFKNLILPHILNFAGHSSVTDSWNSVVATQEANFGIVKRLVYTISCYNSTHFKKFTFPKRFI
jgi:hypothetical protein